MCPRGGDTCHVTREKVWAAAETESECSGAGGRQHPPPGQPWWNIYSEDQYFANLRLKLCKKCAKLHVGPGRTRPCVLSTADISSGAAAEGNIGHRHSLTNKIHSMSEPSFVAVTITNYDVYSAVCPSSAGFLTTLHKTESRLVRRAGRCCRLGAADDLAAPAASLQCTAQPAAVTPPSEKR